MNSLIPLSFDGAPVLLSAVALLLIVAALWGINPSFIEE